jgi:serine/threonine-protein kinase
MHSIPLLEEGVILGGRWRLLGHIATGGKGIIYLAEHCELGRKAAVKMISPEFLRSVEDSGEAGTEVERFRREMRIMAQIRHPNVVQVFDQGTLELSGRDYDYYVMEYVPGPTMRQSMPEVGFGRDEDGLRRWLAEVFLPLLSGVEALHAMGVLHRDLKPENVLLDGGTPRIADFGLAGARFAPVVTRSHHVIGTIFYMAPEQFTDLQLADARMEVYALGKILYEAAAGRMRRDTSFIMETARLPQADGDLLRGLDRIVRRATAKDVGERIPGVRELRAELEALPLTPARRMTDKAPADARPPRQWWPAVALAVLILVLAVMTMRHFGPAPLNPITSVPQVEEPTGGLRVSADEKPPSRGGELPITLAAKDGGLLRLVPTGNVVVSEEPGADRRVSLPAFYLGSTEVTNLQFVEFLNSSLNRLEVRDGAVVHGEQIWLQLGEVRDGVEPIIFAGGEFRIGDPSLAANPVVRVTASGAAAYAAHHGQRLPTAEEWALAAGALPEPNRNGEEPDEEGQVQLPVGLPPENGLGLRGLDGNVREWAACDAALGATKNQAFVVMGDTEALEGKGLKRGGLVGRQGLRDCAPLPRQPWEAFEDVGFRTAISAPRQGPAASPVG